MTQQHLGAEVRGRPHKIVLYGRYAAATVVLYLISWITSWFLPLTLPGSGRSAGVTFGSFVLYTVYVIIYLAALYVSAKEWSSRYISYIPMDDLMVIHYSYQWGFGIGKEEALGAGERRVEQGHVGLIERIFGNRVEVDDMETTKDFPLWLMTRNDANWMLSLDRSSGKSKYAHTLPDEEDQKPLKGVTHWLMATIKNLDELLRAGKLNSEEFREGIILACDLANEGDWSAMDDYTKMITRLRAPEALSRMLRT